jgi:hypothetical protein
MPNARVPANAVSLPKLTRRSLLVGTAACAAAVGPSAASAKAPLTAATAPDADLLALEQTLHHALADYETARRYYNACEERYYGLVPDRPKMLTIAGPLGHFLEDKWDWWRAAELRRVLKDDGYADTWEAARAALPVARAYEARLRRSSA